MTTATEQNIHGLAAELHEYLLTGGKTKQFFTNLGIDLKDDIVMPVCDARIRICRAKMTGLTQFELTLATEFAAAGYQFGEA